MRWAIHIGPQKTGSKAIQQLLVREPEKILAPRVVYPDEGREWLWHEPVFRALLAGDASAIVAGREHYRDAPVDLGIWSCEAFHALPAEAIAQFREELGPAQIVLVLRRQDQRLNSFLNQLVMAHRVTIDQIHAFEDSLTEYQPEFDYRATIEKWADAFSMEQITPLLYDKRVGVVDPFCRALDITLAPDRQRTAAPNPAIDDYGYGALRELKESRPPVDDLPALMTHAIADLQEHLIDTTLADGIELIDRDTQRSIMRLYAESNEWVRSRWFPSSSWPEDRS